MIMSWEAWKDDMAIKESWLKSGVQDKAGCVTNQVRKIMHNIQKDMAVVLKVQLCFNINWMCWFYSNFQSLAMFDTYFNISPFEVRNTSSKLKSSHTARRSNTSNGGHVHKRHQISQVPFLIHHIPDVYQDQQSGQQRYNNNLFQMIIAIIRNQGPISYSNNNICVVCFNFKTLWRGIPPKIPKTTIKTWEPRG